MGYIRIIQVVVGFTEATPGTIHLVQLCLHYAKHLAQAKNPRMVNMDCYGKTFLVAKPQIVVSILVSIIPNITLALPI